MGIFLVISSHTGHPESRPEHSVDIRTRIEKSLFKSRNCGNSAARDFPDITSGSDTNRFCFLENNEQIRTMVYGALPL
jgi:hypothetical protein